MTSENYTVTNPKYRGVFLSKNLIVTNLEYCYVECFTGLCNHLYDWYDIVDVSHKHRKLVVPFLQKYALNLDVPADNTFKLAFCFNSMIFTQNFAFKKVFDDVSYYNQLFINILQKNKKIHKIFTSFEGVSIIGKYKSFNLFELSGEYLEIL